MLIQQKYDELYQELKALKEYQKYINERVLHLQDKQKELAKVLYFAYKMNDFYETKP